MHEIVDEEYWVKREKFRCRRVGAGLFVLKTEKLGHYSLPAGHSTDHLTTIAVYIVVPHLARTMLGASSRRNPVFDEVLFALLQRTQGLLMAR